MNRFRQTVTDFSRDERGTLLVEFLFLLPMMIWGFIALVAYWDVFRTVNVAQKAAYSIADLLSRQVIVTQTFLNGLDDVLVFLTPGAQGSRVRVTSMRFNAGPTASANDDTYVLVFSYSSSVTAPAYTQSQLAALKPKIPIMDHLDSVIIVETWVDYQPDFDIGVLNMAPGLAGQTFDQFIVTRPRSREVCLSGNPGCV